MFGVLGTGLWFSDLRRKVQSPKTSAQTLALRTWPEAANLGCRV